MRSRRIVAVALNPVTLSMPWIRRQPDLTSTLSIQTLPLNRMPRRVKRRKRSQKLGPLVVIATQSRNRLRRIVSRLETCFDIRRTRGMRRNFEAHAILAAQSLNRFSKPHRLPRVSHPVGSIQIFTVDECSSDRGEKRDRQRLRFQLLQCGFKFVRQRIDLLTMKRAINA